MRRALLLSLAAVLAPCAAWAQGGAPLGPEFRVNSYTTSNQLYPSVAREPGGNFVVVWTSNTQDGSGLGVFGQRYDAAGAPLGGEFRVNTYTTGAQYLASVAMDSTGRFVVVWNSIGQEGNFSIFGQRYSPVGVPLGGEFRVNTYTTGDQVAPSVAADLGDFVVTWASYNQDGSSWGIFGQRFLQAGTPAGGEFRINTYTTGTQLGTSVSLDSGGNFMVVWHSNAEDGSNLGIFGQRYAATGTPAGPEFQVNTYTTNAQAYPAVATDASGNVVVVWHSSLQDGSLTGIFGQRYAAAGAPLGGEFRVNTYTTGYQSLPDVVTDAGGNFVVAWASYGQDGSTYGIFGQRFAATGGTLGPEFRVNTFTPNGQTRPAVAADGPGNFVVTWDSQLQDGLGLGVFGQRFGQILPVELMDYGVE